MGKPTPELLLDHEGYAYIRQQLQDKVLTPHDLKVGDVDKYDTAQLFALLVQKSGLAFPISSGSRESGYKYLEIEPNDVSFRFSRSRSERAEVGRLVDAIINPDHARHSGKLEIVEGQGGGSWRTGNMSHKTFHREEVVKLIDYIAKELAGQTIDLSHVQPKLSVDPAAKLKGMKEALCDGLGIPPSSTSMGFEALWREAIIASKAPIRDVMAEPSKTLDNKDCPPEMKGKARLSVALLSHREGITISPKSKPKGPTHTFKQVIENPGKLVDMYKSERNSDMTQTRREGVAFSMGKVLTEYYGLDPYQIPGVGKAEVKGVPAEAAPALTVNLTQHYVYPLKDNPVVKGFMARIKHNVSRDSDLLPVLQSEAAPLVTVDIRRDPAQNNGLVADVFIKEGAPQRDLLMSKLKAVNAAMQKGVLEP